MTACFVSSRIRWEKYSTMESILGFSVFSLADRILIFRVNWGEVSHAWRHWIASGDQSNLRRGEFVAYVDFSSSALCVEIYLVTMREWSHRMELCLAT